MPEIKSSTLAFGVREIRCSFSAFNVTSTVTVMIDVDCPNANVRKLMETSVHEVLEKTLTTMFTTLEQKKAESTAK